MFTDSQIEDAIKKTTLSMPQTERSIPHYDCVRIAGIWLALQKKLKKPNKNIGGLKHVIHTWACRYVSQSSVEVAATLLGLSGTYPCYNLSSQIILPHRSRLDNITLGESSFDKPNDDTRNEPMLYAYIENADYSIVRCRDDVK